MYEVTNKVVLVTGGASGIGAEVVRNFCDEGAKHVAILDLSEEAGKKLQDEVNSKHGVNRSKFYKVDVTADEQLFSAFQCVVKDHGYIDVVINSAGIMNDSPDIYKKEIEVNLTALVTSTLKAIELMRKDQGGRGGTVINIASIAGLIQIPWMPVYFATKSAVIQFSNCIGHDYHHSKFGVRVLAICFGNTATSLLNNLASFDKNNSLDIFKELNDFPSQSPQSAAKGLIDAYKKGASGSTWLVAANKPAADITHNVTKAYEVMSQDVY